MSEIVEFYSGRKKDWSGRGIEEIQGYSHDALEDVHNYIQWLFPLHTRGMAPAPLLDAATITAFRASEDLRGRLLKSFDVMLDFYGLRRQGVEVIRADDFDERAANWLTPYNHNFLRITRILICLGELGQEAWARAFFRCLERIYRESPEVIGAESFAFWRNAVA